MAKKFLYFIAFCIVAALVGRIGWEMFKGELAAFALVPDTEFIEQEALADNAYEDPSLWYSRPGIGVSDPARWQPVYAPASSEGETTAERAPAQRPSDVTTSDMSDFAVFFIHPTSYLERANWNAPIGSEEAERIASLYVRGMASPFSAASEIWAPRYRQATMGAFLTDAPEGQQAIDAAYADVLEAYRYFLSSLDDDSPIALVGHSQGSLHLLRLLREEVSGSEIAPRIIAVYAVGWPISIKHDLLSLGMPACTRADQAGCVLSWSSFAEPADPSDVMETYAKSTGFDGSLRGDSKILCTNPLTGTIGAEAAMEANLGTLVPNNDISDGELVPGAVPARCDERGLLLIGDPPEMGSYVLPGNNYHVYDIPLFWANTQADIARRVLAWQTAR